MLFFYIRHGDPNYDPDSLTPLGRRQAEALAKRLARYGLDKIYASSSTRAMQTAAPAAELCKVDTEILDWSNERYAWDELTVADAATGEKQWLYQDEAVCAAFVSPEVTALGDNWHNDARFSGKRHADGIARIKRETYALLGALGYEHDSNRRLYKAVAPNDKRVALFAHEGFGMAFLSAVLDIPYPMFCTRFCLGHSGMTVIRFDGTDTVIPKVLQLSNDSHLFADGLPTCYNNEIYF